jgi:phosphatidylglycerophosphate synthase
MFEVKLTRHQLKRLAEHKYSSDGISLLDPIMQRYWRWVVELIPLWWAPNSITLVGLTINIVTALILMLYSPDGRGEPPGWSYILCAVGLFTYQTLDAIDGKQARRTKSSTPLGELFDHGCDSVSIVFIVVCLSITLQLGTNPELLFFECFASMFVFYAAHWKTYCTGTLKFGLIDVTEGQLMVVFLFLITSQTGTAFWSLRLFMGLPMKSIFMVSSIIYVIVLAHSHFQLILTKGGVGRNGSTVAVSYSILFIQV